MNLAPQTRRHRSDSVVPMINVAFLMLIFFLMMAQITPPDTIEVIPPTAEGEDPADVGDILLIGKDGTLAYRDLRGDAVFTALAARTDDAPLAIKAASDGESAAFAALLSRLSRAGVTKADLIVVRP